MSYLLNNHWAWSPFYVVSFIRQFIHTPRPNRILQYLKGYGWSLWMCNSMHAFVSTYMLIRMGDLLMVITCYCTFVGGNLVIWKGKIQNMVTKLSMKVKYRAMFTIIVQLFRSERLELFRLVLQNSFATIKLPYTLLLIHFFTRKQSILKFAILHEKSYKKV